MQRNPFSKHLLDAHPTVYNNGADILSEAACELHVDEGIDRLDDMEAIVSGIIRDLEAVEPSIFEPVDEGIALNVEDEFGNLMNEYEPW